MNEKYITKNNNSYRLDRKINEKTRRSGSFKTLNDAIVARQYLIDHNWEYPHGRNIYKYNDTYYLFKYVNSFVLEFKSSNIDEVHNFIKENKDITYIQKRKNKYIILKTKNRKKEWFGSYETLKEAIQFRNKVIQHNWDYTYFKELYKNSTTIQNKYITKEKGKYAVVRVYKNHTRSYGHYTTIEKARKRRDYLDRLDWNEKSTKFMWEYNNNWYVVKNNTFKDKPRRAFYYRSKSKSDAARFRDKCLEEGFPEPLFITGSLRFIEHSSHNLFLIRKSNVSYGSANNLRDAMVLRDLLEQNCWNLKVGTYIWHGEEYFIDFGRKGSTFQICKC